MGTLNDFIDPLGPPYFKPVAPPKTINQAIEDGNWLGGIHIWLYVREPEAAVILQVRSRNSRIAPNKLDVAVGGHYNMGEHGLDGLRELREELGIGIPTEDCEFWGMRLFVDIDSQKRERKFAMSTYLAEYKGALEDITPQTDELEGVFLAPLVPLLQVLYGRRDSLTIDGIDDKRKPATYLVEKDAFYHNPDNYHLHLLEHIAFKLVVKI